MGKFLTEFKEFAVKGNAIDMAVGVIIGGAFGKIVSSLVDDIIMPPIGWLIGGVNFSDLKVTLPAEKIAEGIQMKSATINFLVIALCIFLMIKAINKILRKPEPEPKKEAPAEPTPTEKLLTEIRDELKKK